MTEVDRAAAEVTRKAFIARQPSAANPRNSPNWWVHLAQATYTTGQIHVIYCGWTV